MDYLECILPQVHEFCRLCFDTEGEFRKIEISTNEVLPEGKIPYLVEKHLQVKIFETSYFLCQSCCTSLVNFEEFYTKVHKIVERYCLELPHSSQNEKQDFPEGDSSNQTPNLQDSPARDPKELHRNDIENDIVIEQVQEEIQPVRLKRSCTLKKTTSENSSSQKQSKKTRKKKQKKVKKPNSSCKQEDLFKNQEKREHEIRKNDHKRSVSTGSFTEFDFREDSDNDSDDETPNSDQEIRPRAMNLDEYPNPLIENGLLKVKGKELMNLICKFYTLECDICVEKTKFTYLQDLFNHYTTVHHQKGYVMCCSSKFTRYPAIIMHMARHIQPDAFKCDLCGYMVSRPRFLESHKKTHLPEDQKPFACDQCPRRFCWKNAYELHKLSHQPREERKFFICDSCGNIYDTPGGLCAHRKLSHSNYKPEPHVCHMCAKKFATKTGLNEHMSTIHQPREKGQVQCVKCGKWLMNKRSLKSHLILHSSALFKCESCDYTAKKKSLLTRHQLTQHTNEKPFVCNVCGKAFKLKRALTIHMNQHGNTKQYKCTFCDRVFNSSTNFYTHRKTVHPDELNAMNQAKLEEERQKRIEAGVEIPQNSIEEAKLIVIPTDFINNPLETYQLIDEGESITAVITNPIPGGSGGSQ
ncbi:zinc finger protein 37-like [Sergentomyia squamirostris]